MTPAERADAMGYGRRCCARCRWFRDCCGTGAERYVCTNDDSDANGQTRCLGDLCGEWKEREVEGE